MVSVTKNRYIDELLVDPDRWINIFKLVSLIITTYAIVLKAVYMHLCIYLFIFILGSQFIKYVRVSVAVGLAPQVVW